MILADSSFWIALRDRRDTHHERASALIREILAKRWPITITDHIFAETHAYFVRSVVLRKTIIRDLLENPVVRLETIEAADRNRALKYLREFDDKHWSYCDALSFAVIERLKLPFAASFDHHFGQPGSFELIR
ncbi:MAG: type II toxin-antitoxin system VapC family toxin [Verrucomicrobiae bacterium]|nr:type II toxin-antitoxin system VapC family toxin [Verrucomicrobiae bacterium]